MEAISYSAARQHLKETMDRVCRDRTPVTILRQRAESVVMMSVEDYNSLMETLHLLRSPRNSERLAEALGDARERRNLREAALLAE